MSDRHISDTLVGGCVGVTTFKYRIMKENKTNPFARRDSFHKRNGGGFKSGFCTCKKSDGWIRSNSSHWHHIVGHYITSLMTYYSIAFWIWFLIKTQQFSIPKPKFPSKFSTLSLRVLVKSLFEHSKKRKTCGIVLAKG